MVVRGEWACMYVWSRARGSGKMSGGSERMKGDGIDR